MSKLLLCIAEVFTLENVEFLGGFSDYGCVDFLRAVYR